MASETRHLQAFRPRKIAPQQLVAAQGWRLKRYAIFADDRRVDDVIDVIDAATRAALARLPSAGDIADAEGNHGVGFQIVHFAETAIVSPTFYWRWGSVLSRIDQLRAPLSAPTAFTDGIGEIVGCVWEMEIVGFETDAWRNAMLSDRKLAAERLREYFETVAT